MARKRKTQKIALMCTKCGNRIYVSTKNPINIQSKLELKKFCPKCKKHTLHKETRVATNT